MQSYVLAAKLQKKTETTKEIDFFLLNDTGKQFLIVLKAVPKSTQKI
jgi:hypothetical protein